MILPSITSRFDKLIRECVNEYHLIKDREDDQELYQVLFATDNFNALRFTQSCYRYRLDLYSLEIANGGQNFIQVRAVLANTKDYE